MNKFKVLILIVLTILLTACGVKKEALDEDEFIIIMKKEGFNIVNVENQFEQYGYFEDAYIAIDPNSNYQIEFYELEDDNYAKRFYENNKQKFESQKSGKNVSSYKELINTGKYTLTTEESYKVVSRIEDTVVYLDVDKKYKEEVNNILKKLGY